MTRHVMMSRHCHFVTIDNPDDTVAISTRPVVAVTHHALGACVLFDWHESRQASAGLQSDWQEERFLQWREERKFRQNLEFDEYSDLCDDQGLVLVTINYCQRALT